jgi:N-methylhydantoinase B
MIAEAHLRVIASRLQGVAEAMGVALIRASASANIKERQDCSTALFDASGEMVAQAEHIPAHLGAMPDAVSACLELELGAGDVAILNDPFHGGNHLPDITLVSPIFVNGTRLAYAASRAHHADVGGREPGSMPAGARSIFEEGVLIPPVLLVREGQFDQGLFTLLLANMRNPRDRRIDLRAQLAAHQIAEKGITDLVDRYGIDGYATSTADLLAYGERSMRNGIRRLPDGVYRAEDVLEGDGTHENDIPIRVEVTVSGDTVGIDFAGTAPRQPGNVNCPLSVTKSACLFALRVLCAPDQLATAGALRPLTIAAPSDCLVNAQFPSAVAAGNVETSSRIADTVLLAFSSEFGLLAQGQGTMNNVTIGNAKFTYYETIAGGQGANANGDGPDGVHVAMSNTLNTPIEALELEYPLRVEKYAIRRGSGGSGRFRGGDGVVRSIRVLEPCRVSILSDRRRNSPQGVAGGAPGAPGRNLLNGRPLPAKSTRPLRAHDVITIETPGGGGYGGPAVGASPSEASAHRGDSLDQNAIAATVTGVSGRPHALQKRKGSP